MGRAWRSLAGLCIPKPEVDQDASLFPVSTQFLSKPTTPGALQLVYAGVVPPKSSAKCRTQVARQLPDAMPLEVDEDGAVVTRLCRRCPPNSSANCWTTRGWPLSSSSGCAPPNRKTERSQQVELVLGGCVQGESTQVRLAGAWDVQVAPGGSRNPSVELLGEVQVSFAVRPRVPKVHRLARGNIAWIEGESRCRHEGWRGRRAH